MKIAFIGDIVGRPGREMIKIHLKKLRETYEIDFVIANYENASHGYGLTPKNCNELINSGVDLMTGGNHSFDKKEIKDIFESHPLIRPLNYSDEVAGEGYKIVEVKNEKLAVINLMGHFGMPFIENAFLKINKKVDELLEEGIKNIFIDFHAEATAEKRALFMMLKDKVSAIIGTHTHVGCDDLQIVDSCAYLSDIGLTGCRDNVIGMDKREPIQRMLTGLSGHFDVPKKCKKILQIAILDIEDGDAKQFIKLKVFDDSRVIKSEAYID